MVATRLFSFDGCDMDNIMITKSFSWDVLRWIIWRPPDHHSKEVLHLIINMVDAKLFDFTPS
jgi:hypothetical protein